MRTSVAAFGFIALACTAIAQPDTTPANPHANATVRAVLQYFQSLSDAKDQRIISGQFSDFGQGASVSAMTNVYKKTGHWPGIIGVDYAKFGGTGLETAEPNQAAIAYWNGGGLVTISA